MKKSIFILAALLAATFANAQINLLHTFDGYISISMNIYGDQYNYIETSYFYECSPAINNGYATINLYNSEDFSLYKTVLVPALLVPASGSYWYISAVSRNLFTQDNKVCFCLWDADASPKNTYVYNEDAQQIAILNGGSPRVVSINGTYRLITSGEGNTYIYSLPGNGESTEISAPSSPKRSARKIARDGQVLVETDTNTYTLQGAEVK